jgi:hypothetical protein
MYCLPIFMSKEPLKQRVIEEHQKIYHTIEDLKKGNHSTDIFNLLLPTCSTNISALKKENYLITCSSTLARSQLSAIAAQHQSEKIKDVDGQWDRSFLAT